MAALMEYIVVCIYIGTGFMIPATRRVSYTATEQGQELPVLADEGRRQHGKLQSFERQYTRMMRN
jgi:hypothetical protein